MTIDTLRTIALLLACAVLAAILISKFRHFLDWRKGDDLHTHVTRALEERQKDIDAKTYMFGSRKVTLIANLVTMVVVILMAFSFLYPTLKLVLFAHLAVGYFVSRRSAREAKGKDYDRLQLPDRIWYHLFYSAIWPIVLITKSI